MKKLIGILVIVLFAGTLSALSQSVTNTTISGIFTEYKTLTGNYDVDTDTLTGPLITFEWLSYDGSGGNEVVLDSTRQKLVLDPSASLEGRRLKFVVNLSNSYADTVVSDTSALSITIIANSVPEASNASINAISGNMNVGSTLLADYDYSDTDGDAEGASTIAWYKGPTAGTATTNPITGANEKTYNIHIDDTGQFLKYIITPVAATGNPNAGTPVTSSASLKVNNAPYVDNVSFPASVDPLDDIQVTYDFHDPDGDGDACTFRWFREGIEFINQSDSYTTVAEDQGLEFYVIITPVSDNGYPNTGDDYTTGTCTVTVSNVPEASGVCIQGRRKPGATLYGSYSYEKNDTRDEGQSRILWYVNDTLVKEGKRTDSGIKNLNLSDKSHWVNSKIVFKVVPYAGWSNPTIGDTVSSSAFTRITNTVTNFSISEDPELLNATPLVDEFHGNGVYESGGSFYFDPGDEDVIVGSANEIYHEIVVGTCNQKAYIDFHVDSSKVAFDDGFKNFFCYEDTDVTIGLLGIDDANYVSGSGSFSLSPDVPGGIISAPDEFEVRVNPRALGPGNNHVRLVYNYMSVVYDTLPGPIVIPIFIPNRIEKGFVVEFINPAMAISNLPDEYCEIDDTLNLFLENRTPAGGTGIWSSPLIINQDNESSSIVPGADGAGIKTIEYEYTTSLGCKRTVTKNILIHPAPTAAFTLEDECIEFENDSTRFMDASSGNIVNWAWIFDTSDGTIYSGSDKDEIAYLYKTDGKRDVVLEVTTDRGCTGRDTVEIDLGIKPVADFYWEKDCFYADSSLFLFDNTHEESPVTTWKWTFDTDPEIVFDTRQDTVYMLKEDVGYVNVRYVVETDYAGCGDEIEKSIWIRPTVILKDSLYFEDFESEAAWIVDGLPSNTWSLGKPENFLGTGAPENKSWYTNPLAAEQVTYSVESPCFDFREVERPMIRMDILRNFDDGRDGAVLQYTVGTNQVWNNIGGTDFGINWYENSNIAGRPGQSVVGWSQDEKDSDWVEARQYLDKLVDSVDVKLRIAYGSDGYATGSEGFAFDNIWIGERTRKVLVEHFTNYNYSEVVDPDNELNSIIEDAGNDAMNIQYHTNYRADDQLYSDNTAVPGSRMLFYSLVRNPYTIFDGGVGTDYSTRYDWSQTIAEADINDLRNRSLVDPVFDIKIDTLPNYLFNVSVEPLQEIHESNVTLFLAVTAKKITSLTGSNGQTEFRNVLRKMLPDAGGIALKKDWSPTEGQKSYGPYSRNISEAILHESDSVEIIAFLQNNITKEVYQAASSGSLPADISTSIGRVGFDEANFKIFPNPAGSNLTLLLDREVYGKSGIKFYNNAGLLIKEVDLPRGVDRYTIEDLGLPDGMYLVKLIIDGRPQGYSKLVVTRR